MLRVLLREALLTALVVAVASVVGFAALDLSADNDWHDTAAYAHLFGFSRAHATGADLPLLWEPNVRDAAERTRNDLAALRGATADAAADRIVRRGSAAWPTVYAALPRLDTARARRALNALARISPRLTGGESAPTVTDAASEARATAWWSRFDEARGLDFRPGFAARQAERVTRREGSSARERLVRLGTFALPEVARALDREREPEARARLSEALSDITGLSLRVPDDAPEGEVARVADAWGAWWFAERLEYETLPAWERGLGHVLETRYGRWLTSALQGRLGRSAVTRRPVWLELRERLPVSALASGLGGLVAVAAVIAFGGGAHLRRRRLRPKLYDLAGALLPGLVALLGAWSVLARVAAPTTDLSARMGGAAGAARLTVTTLLIAAAAGAWLLRPRATLALSFVRAEAEGWLTRRARPTLRERLRHAVRIALASILAPLGLAAPVVILASLAVERVVGLPGMGDLTARSLLTLDGPWLIVATLTVVPLLLGRRWALAAMLAVLGAHDEPHDDDDHDGGTAETEASASSAPAAPAAG
ncbi:MAG: hypothetical protein R3A52_30715 [Polyangiales bacterium]